jgi:antitoxin component YwqK of YwqJK toxin-antitoxin module
MRKIFGMNLKMLMLWMFFICFSVSAQQKTASGIKKVTEYEQDYDKGVADGNAKIKAEYIYDAQGNLTEEAEYKDGKKDHTITYVYDKDNRKTKEIEKNASGKVTRVSEYKYENGLKTERITYNGENQIKSKKTFRYEKAE